MMLSLAIFKILVAALVSAAAWMVERSFARRAWPVRWIWVAAILLTSALPPASISRDSAAIKPNPGPIPVGSIINPGVGMVGRMRNDYQHILVDWPQLDAFLGPAARGLPGLALLVVAAGWLNQRRLLKRTRSGTIDGAPVLLSERAGPAVVGFLAPRILVPEWLAGMPKPVRELVIAHERAHIRTGDHRLLLGLVVFVAATADLATIGLVIWQFGKFRFALEIDCDRRIVADTDPVAYANALLAIAERRSDQPAGALALVEGTSNLERRIRAMMAPMMAQGQWATSLAVQLPLAAAAALLLGAAALDAPLEPYPRLVQWIHSHADVALTAQELARYAGTYKSEDGRGVAQFAADGDHLVVVAEAGLAALRGSEVFVPKSATDFLLTTLPRRAVRLTFCDMDRYGQSHTIAVNDQGRFTTLRRTVRASGLNEERQAAALALRGAR